VRKKEAVGEKKKHRTCHINFEGWALLRRGKKDVEALYGVEKGG